MRCTGGRPLVILASAVNGVPPVVSSCGVRPDGCAAMASNTSLKEQLSGGEMSGLIGGYFRLGVERLEDDLRPTDFPRPRGASRSASAPPSRYLRHHRVRVLGL